MGEAWEVVHDANDTVQLYVNMAPDVMWPMLAALFLLPRQLSKALDCSECWRNMDCKIQIQIGGVGKVPNCMGTVPNLKKC